MEHQATPAKISKQRTLAAVVFTDGVGFSSRMSANEEQTLELIRNDLRLMQDLCEQQYEGHVLKSTGDGLLMYFSSAVQAVRCALEIQERLADIAAQMPETEVLRHRIGIHLGDVFVTEEDVMGTGVNIAARLQSAASPGGICVSQLVYDVVKTSLNLQASYLGPLTLKNIHEAIPAYLLRPAAMAKSQPDGSTEMTEIGTPDEQDQDSTRFTASSPDPYELVIQGLTNDRNSTRIRKLLLCTCRNQWENNPDRLAQLNLRDLLQELQRSVPSLDALKFKLDSIVSSLSKPEQYSQVAIAILRQVKPLYPDTPDLPSTLYISITHVLTQHKHLLRIKKLLYCVWTDQWENDPSILNNLDLGHLIRDVHSVSPTLEHLTLALNNIVRTLSKPDTYILVANTIAAQFSKLYLTPTLHSEPVTESTRVLSYPASSPTDDTTLRSSMPTANADLTLVMDLNDDADAPLSTITQAMGISGLPSPPPTTIAPPISMDGYLASLDLFQIKQEVMSYAIPMRVKILLYSVLYQKFNFNTHDWSVIKLHHLEDMLKSILREFNTLSDLESRLEILARCLEEPDEYIQVVGTISQALEPIYRSRPPKLIDEAKQPSLPASMMPMLTPEILDAETAVDGQVTIDLQLSRSSILNQDLSQHPQPAEPLDDDRTRQL